MFTFQGLMDYYSSSFNYFESCTVERKLIHSRAISCKLNKFIGIEEESFTKLLQGLHC